MKYQKILYKLNPVRLFLKIILSTFYTQKLSENFLFKKKLYRELSVLKHKGLEINVVYDVPDTVNGQRELLKFSLTQNFTYLKHQISVNQF